MPRTPGSFEIWSLTRRSVSQVLAREDVVRLHRDHEQVVVAEVEHRALVHRLARVVLGQHRLARRVDADAEAERLGPDQRRGHAERHQRRSARAPTRGWSTIQVGRSAATSAAAQSTDALAQPEDERAQHGKPSPPLREAIDSPRVLTWTEPGRPESRSRRLEPIQAGRNAPICGRTHPWRARSGTHRIASRWLMLLGALGVPASLLWDFAWESTIGVDRFFGAAARRDLPRGGARGGGRAALLGRDHARGRLGRRARARCARRSARGSCCGAALCFVTSADLRPLVADQLRAGGRDLAPAADR